MSSIAVSDEEFEAKVLKSGIPVLVDYWAEWCAPCHAVAPHLEDIAKEMGDKITVAKVDIDQNPQTPSTYNVRGIPTLMIFKNGKVVGHKVGALSKPQLTEWVNEIINS